MFDARSNGIYSPLDLGLMLEINGDHVKRFSGAGDEGRTRAKYQGQVPMYNDKMQDLGKGQYRISNYTILLIERRDCDGVTTLLLSIIMGK